MEVYQIRVFLEVARHLSFTEASDVLNLTQPAVSAKIKSLEMELGTPLFHRLGRKIQLTDVGEFLLENGPKLIDLENDLLQEIEHIKKGKSGIIKIGCTSEIGNGWLPTKLFAYRQKYPNLQIQCNIFDSVELLYRSIINNEIDIGFSDINFADVAEISSISIASIRYSLFVSAHHPLAHKKWLSLSDLKHHPWVLMNSEAPSRKVLESRLTEIGLSLSDFSNVETVDTSSLMRTYMTQGAYLGFASNLEFQLECQAGNLVAISLQEFALSGSIFLLTPKGINEINDLNDHKLPKLSRGTVDLTPTQKLVKLLQEHQHQQVDVNTNVNNAMQMRSPSFALRTANSNRPETLTLSIGIQNGTIPSVTAGLIIQRLQLLSHFLPKDGRYSGIQFQIEWQNFATGSPIVTGLDSGTLNIGILGDYPLLLSALPNPETAQYNTRLVSFVSSNPDGSGNAFIVPHQSKVETIADLRGQNIAVPLRSSAHGMVMRSLQAANLLDQVELISLEHIQAIRGFNFPLHLADSYAHFAPFHDVACRCGKFRYLADGNLDILPSFYGVVVNHDLADRYPEVVIAYLQSLKAAQYWYDNTPSAPAQVAQWTRLDLDLVTEILNGSYQPEQTARFFSETVIRPDWLKLHIDHLSKIPNNENLTKINLDRWIQPEFLKQTYHS
ncbi:LysR family transcriptional regulator [Phormidium tenue]|jgi:NitT/TauT family transport system substrate-binding protein|uniref:LysR family transcriptional regulator n=1 Tax=Phormidium tenue FACHB-1050 TaxID=2692857 RepID=A0ABR8C645_9CYAN|nr:LysR substrate-binding domain-containing protein [Phormidium tenue]MBD2315688.1 LysR family transcriptional regulator [Phormidium tenue FACHB-1050]